MIESRGTLRCVCECVSPFRWLDCLVFVSAACFCCAWVHRLAVKPNTRSGRKAFPKTPAWFLYEVRCHTRWARSAGESAKPDAEHGKKKKKKTSPAPLKIYSEKLRRCVFLARDAPGFNTASVNQSGREKRRGEKVERIRQSWPLILREGYLCERGERSRSGYEEADFWCWQETLTFGVKLEFMEAHRWLY